jgi:hypothetical protein
VAAGRYGPVYRLEGGKGHSRPALSREHVSISESFEKPLRKNIKFRCRNRILLNWTREDGSSTNGVGECKTKYIADY